MTIASAAAPASERWSCERLGHIFLAGQPVRLGFATAAPQVEWSVTDFWHREVEHGTAAAASGQVAITPKVAGVGYYLVHVVPRGAGAAAGAGATSGPNGTGAVATAGTTGALAGETDSYTSFAIVRPHVSADELESKFGTMTHFAQGMNPELLPALKQIGIESVRDEHYWGQVEREKGVYEFPAKSDAWMRACAEAGIHPLIPLTFGNKLYDGEKGPFTPSGYEGYAKYGVAVLNHYGPQIHWVEVWNEYNGTWAPDAAKKDRPAFYAEMLKTAYREIKAARPDVQVLGGAAVLIPLPWFEGLFQRDALKSMDAVVIHPYRPRPEGVDTEVAALQELIRKYNGGQNKPVWATETGRQSKEEYDWETGRKMYEKGHAEVARYLPRQYTLLLKQHVARIYWYLASDHGGFATMGLLRNHLEEPSGMGRYAVAPAYVAYANLIQQLGGAEFVRREAMREYTRVYVELFRRGPEEIRVCWATQPARIRVRTAKALTVANLMGAESTLTPAEGEAGLALTEDALFLRGPVSEVSEVDTGVRVLASSLDDYSKTQGENHWSYGAMEEDGAFAELQQVETMWGYKWGGHGPSLSIWNSGMHPDKAGGKDVQPVRRWECPVEGRVTVRYRWANAGKGDGVTALIRVDGKEVYRQPVGGAATKVAEGELEIAVKKGSLVDFALRPNANTNFDATETEFTLVQKTR